LRHALSELLSYLLDTTDDSFIRLGFVGSGAALGTSGLDADGATEMASGDGTPWNESDPIVVTVWVHFSLLYEHVYASAFIPTEGEVETEGVGREGDAHLFPIQQANLVLHAHKLRPPILLRNILQHRKLPRSHTRCTNIPDLPTLNQIVKGFHDFFRWYIRIEAVNLQEIHVGSLQAREGSVDGVKDSLTGESVLVDVFGVLA
jgi:hypothetical protein